MREINSTQRRRRLRLIKAESEQAVERSHHAASILAPASSTDATRIEVERIHRRMMMECRAKIATRIRIECTGKDPQIVTWNRPYFLIGSSPTCDLRLDHEDISPHHSLLQWVNGQIFCCDLVPRLGADRNQQSNGKWCDNDPIKIGPYQLSLENHELPIKFDESPLERSAQLAEEFPQLAFQFAGVEQRENLWPVNRTLTMIGRGSQCKLRLNHASMPNVQAYLLRTRHGCWLVDIEGTGTTGVNGRAISIAPIDIGDILQLGPFQIEVVSTPITNQEVAAPRTTKKSENSRQASKVEPPNHVPVQLKPKSSVIVSSSEEAISEKKPVAEVDLRQSILDTEELPKTEPIVVPTEAFDPSIQSFLQLHQTQLSLLKTQLEQVKAVYDKPRSQSNSKRARKMLDKSIGETMKTHKLMQESFEKLTSDIRR